MEDDSDSIGLYLHVPFCLSKCNYCDFNTYEGIEGMMSPFVDALEGEIAIWAKRLGRPRVSTIFFGGGTPSYLASDDVVRIMDVIQREMKVERDAEVSLEANPDDVTEAKLSAWLGGGINRLSIGVQSFDDDMLASLGRRHDAEGAARAVKRARATGFENMSIDLMYGLPRLSLQKWTASLEAAAELETDHLSLYCLQVEPGTPLHRSVDIGVTPRPSDDLAADMYETCMDMLGGYGYDHYEISNWAKSGMESRHNMTYWLNRQYLGVGPGAHSSLGDLRFANMKSPRRYIDAIRSFDGDWSVSDDLVGAGCVAVDFIEETSVKMSMSETMMLGLRLARGVSYAEFQQRYGISIDDVYGGEIERLISLGLMEKQDERLCLTRRGKLLGNEVFECFVLIESEDD